VQLVRWNDDRLDDLARLVQQNDQRIDALQNLAAAHDLHLTEMERERRSRLDQRFSFRLALLTVLIGQVGTILTVLLTQH
jgi:hypothetical protein